MPQPQPEPEMEPDDELKGMTREQLKAEEAKILAELEELGWVECKRTGKFKKRPVGGPLLRMSEDPIEVMFRKMDVDK